MNGLTSLVRALRAQPPSSSGLQQPGVVQASAGSQGPASVGQSAEVEVPVAHWGAFVNVCCCLACSLLDCRLLCGGVVPTSLRGAVGSGDLCVWLWLLTVCNMNVLLDVRCASPFGDLAMVT